MAKVQSKIEPKKKGTILRPWLIVAAFVVIVLIVAAIALSSPQADDGDRQTKDFEVGDYMKYQFSGTAYGVMYMNCTFANETSFVFSLKLFHDSYVEQPPSISVNRTYDILYFSGNPIEGIGDEFVGVEEIFTKIGQRSADHYLDMNDNSTINVYVGSDTGVILILHQVSIDLNDITVELVETNVEWI